ncbi:TraB family protein (plasmid) [Thioalkalivibrio sp. K90mix]|uniref:TraB family protein n=1 Tax=Thioalkalivibrio sp. (strain K90mix) TaxID=396595 RepID=UPI000195A724|nr:TraB family protein [Thioalkalivibrio sp. K90mix]ADC73291.1 TraB family protein [Thioalkalivibrio sp. K90mix]
MFIMEKIGVHRASLEVAWPPAVLLAAAAFGAISLNTTAGAVLLLLAQPLLWGLAPNRWLGGLASGLFVAGAAWTVAPAVPAYFGNDQLLFGVLSVAIVAFIHALVWAIAWTDRPHLRVINALLVIALFMLPPLAWIGWASPVNAAGILFPGTGWFGFVLLAAVLALGLSGRAAMVAGLLTISLVALMPQSTVWIDSDPEFDQWQGVDTALGDLELTHGPSVVDRQVVLQQKIEGRYQGQFVLLPETVAGVWEFAEPMWEHWDGAPRGALIGAALQGDAPGYHNSLVGIGALRGMRYDQRMPIPWAMWNPLDPESAHADIFGPGTVQAPTGEEIGVLLCYEQLIGFPMIQTFWVGPDVVLAPTNAWWAYNNAIPRMQEYIVSAWGRLFGVPVVTSVNYSHDIPGRD